MVLYILGNGFSISLIQGLVQANHIESNLIRLDNLFAQGDAFSVDENSMYLSSEYCSALQSLGVSSRLTDSDAKEIINNLVTSFNVYSKWRNANISNPYHRTISSVYVQAYDELNIYLKRLFIYYNSLVSDEMLLDLIDNERIPLLTQIKKSLNEYNNIKIITYNYDVFLERVLSLANIRYNLVGFTYDMRNHISIYKPHGSINYSCKTGRGHCLYDRLNINIDNLYIDKKLRIQDSFSSLIAPFGNAMLNINGWTSYIRNQIQNIVVSPLTDKVIILGHSYGEIDRPEIDNILIKIPKSAQICYIDPKPSQTLVYILKTIFDNVIIMGALKEEVI